ncbi:MAG: TlyA family RNA methyltransferase [Hyphomonadaceae bacterium]
MSGNRERADKLLVALGHFESRTAARAAIDASGVVCDGEPVRKPSQMLPVDGVIVAKAAHPFVSRGGVKLAHALEAFDVDVRGRSCLDVGASTGGFTDCLLQNGAARVTAIDVGRDQLHARVRTDARVTVFEGVDARTIGQDHVLSDLSLIVTDLSFIALEKALEPALALAASDTLLVGLFKPQFQVGRKNVGRGGIVTDLEAVGTAVAAFSEWVTAQGWSLENWCDSPIRGGDGNREKLFLGRKI